ncbi:hypothetical protein OQA88_4042 [Cercophora sp. LCS_1]
MESAGTGLTGLPHEILLHIISYLEPEDTVKLQLVSRALKNLAVDNNLWRARCFSDSTFVEAVDRRRLLFGSGTPLASARHPSDKDGSAPSPVALSMGAKERDRIRLMANWDPSFPAERVTWYDEYIQRHGPICVNWFQLPRPEGHSGLEFVEARGVALYRPDNPQEDKDCETLLAVSPLDDGSVCLWDVNGVKSGKRGSLVAKSRPGILFIDGPDADNNRRSKRVDSGVTECVAVDSEHDRAFFAVQSHLIAVDLRRLSVVDCESFPWSITALSTAGSAVPLTVGTSLGIHLYDYRARNPPRDDEAIIDNFDRMGAQDFYQRSLRNLFDDKPLAPYAPLSQPGPLSILHLQHPGQVADLSDDVYVAGRFSNILHYDRRKFPSIKGSIHSGASLCAMTSLPYPFSTIDNDLRRMGELSLEQVEASKSTVGGRTLIACGEYNTKGSLEIYGLSPPGLANPLQAGGLQNACLKNRQTSSQSKLLSVVNHGTRLAFSDGSGTIKWFERDGFSEVRRCKIGHSELSEGPSVFASMPGSDDIARKLLPTRAEGHTSGNGRLKINDNDLLFWTGEKLGLVRISARPGFTSEDFEDQEDDHLRAEERAQAIEERTYSERMRQALERQADDVRFVRNLGIGSGRRRS